MRRKASRPESDGLYEDESFRWDYLLEGSGVKQMDRVVFEGRLFFSIQLSFMQKSHKRTIFTADGLELGA